MYQKDYILRMIEVMAEALAIFFGKLKHKKLEEATKILDNMYYDLLKQDASFFQNLPKEKLTGKLINGHNYTNGHLEVLANLFQAEGELWFAKKEPERSMLLFEKALILFEFVDREYKTFSTERQDKISSIKNKLATLN